MGILFDHLPCPFNFCLPSGLDQTRLKSWHKRTIHLLSCESTIGLNHDGRDGYMIWSTLKPCRMQSNNIQRCKRSFVQTMQPKPNQYLLDLQSSIFFSFLFFFFPAKLYFLCKGDDTVHTAAWTVVNGPPGVWEWWRSRTDRN